MVIDTLGRAWRWWRFLIECSHRWLPACRRLPINEGLYSTPTSEANKGFAEEGIHQPHLSRFWYHGGRRTGLPESERIQVFSILTPQLLHFPMARSCWNVASTWSAKSPWPWPIPKPGIAANPSKKQGHFCGLHTLQAIPWCARWKMITEGVLGAVQK